METEDSKIAPKDLVQALDLSDLAKDMADVVSEHKILTLQSIALSNSTTFDKSKYAPDSTCSDNLSQPNFPQQAELRNINKPGTNADFSDCNDQTPLMAAVVGGNLADVKRIISENKDTNLNARTENGLTALSYAAIHNNNDILLYLLQTGANLSENDKDGNTPLIWCCNRGNSDGIDILLRKGADVNVCNEKGLTALTAATQAGHVSVIRVLLENGANIDCCDNDGNDALFYSVAKSHNTIFHQLLKYGCTLTKKYLDGNCIAHVVASSGQVEMMQSLKEAGVDILNVTNDDGRTPLMSCSCNGSFNMMKYLIEQGASVDAKSNNGRNSLFWAVEKAQNEKLPFLINCTENLNEIDLNGDTALIVLARHGNICGVKSLLTKNINIKTVNKKRKTALKEALSNHHFEVVTLLIQHEAQIDMTNQFDMSMVDMSFTSTIENSDEKDLRDYKIKGKMLLIGADRGNLQGIKDALQQGSDINYQDSNGRTALMVASKKGDPNIVQYLLKEGAKPNLVTSHGLTALAYAVNEENHVILDLLIKYKASVDVCNKDGQTLLFYCAYHGDKDMLIVLDRYGSDIDYADNNGCTPLMAACQQSHLTVVEYLILRGADCSKENKEGLNAREYAFLNGNSDIVTSIEKLECPNILSNSQRMFSCVVDGDLNNLLDIITDGVNINYRNRNRVTSLMVAALKGNNLMMEILCANNANINLRCKKGRTALFYGGNEGCTKQMEWLIDQGAVVDATDKVGNTILLLSSLHGYKESVKLLIKAGADVDHKDEDERTPLMCAAQEGHLEIVKLLVSHGAVVNFCDKHNSDALDFAIRNERNEVVQWLLTNVEIYRQGKEVLHIAASEGNYNLIEMTGKDMDQRDENSRTPLMSASQKGHENIVKLLIDKGANVNAADVNGVSSLMFASVRHHIKVAEILIANGAHVDHCSNGRSALLLCSQDDRTEVVQLLLKSGANINLCDESGKTTLMRAAGIGLIQLVKFLLSYGANPDLTDDQGWNAVHFASRHGNITVLAILTEYGAQVDVRNDNGNTPLIHAVLDGNMSLVEALVLYGADVNYVANDGWTALMCASQEGNTDIAEYLTCKGANLNLKNVKGGFTALIIAIIHESISVVKLLLKKGADTECLDKDGNTPLLVSCSKNNLELVKVLAHTGANLHHSNNSGRTSLMLAAQNGNVDIAKLLITSGVSIDTATNTGKTAILFAAVNDSRAVGEYLFSSGANIEIEDENGFTALFLAILKGHFEMVKLLVTLGAAIDYQNKKGQTALMCASELGYVHVLKYLVEKGASLNLHSYSGKTALDHARLGSDAIQRYLMEMGAVSGHSMRPMQNKIIDEAAIFEAMAKNEVLKDKPEMVELKRAKSQDKRLETTKTNIIQQYFQTICQHGQCNGFLFQFLINNGASIEFVDAKTKCTPIHIAVVNNCPQIVAWLVEAGANVNSNTCRKTAILHAILDDNIDTVDILLSSGVNINLTDENGHTPLICAVINNRIPIVERLLQFDVDLNCKDCEGNSAIQIARNKGFHEIQQLLLK